MTIGALSTIGQSNFIVSQMDKVQKQYQQVQAQLASGQSTDNFGDLGTQASQDITLHNALNTVNDFKNVVAQVQTRTNTMDLAMNAISAAAQTVQNIALATPQPDPTRQNVQTAAQNALQQVAQELGVSVDGRFLFSGTNTAVTAVVSPATLQANSQPFMQAAIQSAAVQPPASAAAVQAIVANLMPGQPPAVQASLANAISTAIAADTDPNTGLALPGVSITGDAVQAAMSNFYATSTNYYQGSNTFAPTSIDVGMTLDYSIAGNNPAFQSILQGLNTLASLPTPTAGGANPVSTADYDKTAAAAAQSIASGLAGLKGLIQTNGDHQQTLQNQSSAQDQTLTFLQKEVDNIESANLPDLSAKLAVLQTQMQASYKVMAGLAQLSLVDYLK